MGEVGYIAVVALQCNVVALVHLDLQRPQGTDGVPSTVKLVQQFLAVYRYGNNNPKICSFDEHIIHIGRTRD